jgi:hypothetical protein
VLRGQPGRHPISNDNLKLGAVLGTVSTLAQVIALVGAGAYFAFKAFVGYTMPNLSLDLTCDRAGVTAAQHVVRVKLRLKKGEAGSLYLHDAALRIRENPGRERIEPFSGFQRVAVARHLTSTGLDLWRLTWREPDEDHSLVALSPEEETLFAQLVDVASDSRATIDVAIVAKRFKGKTPLQWRASCVSLPSDVPGGAPNELKPERKHQSK